MLTDRQVRRANYGTGPHKPTPAQRRILDRFKVAGGVRQLPAHTDHWQRYDMLPLQALIRRGYIRVLIGPHENHYLLTYAGQKLG